MTTTTEPVRRVGKANRAPRDHYQEVTDRITSRPVGACQRRLRGAMPR